MNRPVVEEGPPSEIVAISISALLLVEILMRAGSAIPNQVLRLWSVARPWAGLLCIGMAVGFVSGRKPVRVVVALLSLGLLIVSIFRFRGLWIWPGTFDYYFGSPSIWIWSMPTGFILGIVCSLFLSRKFESRSGFRWGALLSTGVLLALTFVLESVWSESIDSRYPPTRVFVYACIWLALIGLSLVQGRSNA